MNYTNPVCRKKHWVYRMHQDIISHYIVLYGMRLKENFFKDRYHRLELIFFIIYFICFPILSGVEYYVYEPVMVNQSLLKDLPEHLIYGFIDMIPAWICYQYIIKKLLFKKQYLWFFVALLLYLVFHQGYRLGIYWLIAHLYFLPTDMVQSAGRWYANGTFYHVISIYELRDLIVLSALAYFIRSARQDKQISELQQQRLESELNFLKMQIQPHFFFNTLNNIYALTLQGSEKAAPLVARHADSMRYILYESSKQRVSLKQEVAFLQNFVEVEVMHFSDKTDISFEAQGITADALIEPLLLLPFIENAFKHGLREETGEGFIHIVISLVEDDLFAEIKNSKPLQSASEKPGIGLKNVLKRLEILYPNKHRVDITEDNRVFEVRINLIVALQ
jgi:sensor histidine kinase YesM